MNCPECDHEFSPKEVASMLGSLSLGVQKTLSDGERLRRSEAMTAMNKNKKPTVKSVPAKKIPSKPVIVNPITPPVARVPIKTPIIDSIPVASPVAQKMIAVSARKADDPMKRMFAKIPMAAKPGEDFRFKPQTK